MRKERLLVKKVLVLTLKDAIDGIMAMQEKPEVAQLHVGTNDMQARSEDDMIAVIKYIYDVLSTRGMKFMYDFITSTEGELPRQKWSILA